MKNKLRFIVCENMVHDFERVLDILAIPSVEIKSFTSYCSMLQKKEPDKLVDLMDLVLKEDIRVVSCTTCPIRKQVQQLELDWISLDHIFSLLIDGEFIQDQVRKGAYFVSTGWLINAKDNLERFGFEENELAMWLGESIKKILYLNGDGTVYFEHFVELAERLNLSYQEVPIRYDYLQLFIESQYTQWLAQREKRENEAEIKQLMQSVSDYAVMFHIIEELTSYGEERQLIDHIIKTFRMIFGAGEVKYQTTLNQSNRLVYTDLKHKKFCITDTGFIVIIETSEQTIGYLEITNLVFPKFKERYISFSINVAKVLGLAILNLRNLHEIGHLATHDSLTGLYNRSKYEEVIQSLSGQEVMRKAVLVVDIDGLKKTNDDYGHEMGDKLIIQVANLLKEIFRKTDSIFRIGGDEFVVLIDLKRKEDLKSIEQRLIHEMKRESQWMYDNLKFKLSFSFGLAIIENSSETYIDIFRKADQSMYEMKRMKKRSGS
jgi:diguanylate cyclase (GGDEF)-like protein